MHCTCPRCMIIGPGSQPIERRRGELKEQVAEIHRLLEFWGDDVDDTITLMHWRGQLALWPPPFGGIDAR